MPGCKITLTKLWLFVNIRRHFSQHLCMVSSSSSFIKLSEYAIRHGVGYKTAWRWFHQGKIQGAFKKDTGTIYVPVDQNKEPTKSTSVVVYCRVSNANRRSELQYQVDRCLSYCAAKGYTVDAVYKEVASGMNDSRKQLWNALDSKSGIIVVENKDRLTRFGFNYLQRLLKRQNTEVEVINNESHDEQDLMKDLVSVITSFCCRLYGLRRTKNKVNAIKELVHG